MLMSCTTSSVGAVLCTVRVVREACERGLFGHVSKTLFPCKLEPIRSVPNSENPDPSLAYSRKLIEEPKVQQSKTLIADPILALPRRESEEARCAKLSADTPDPNRPIDLTETEDPM